MENCPDRDVAMGWTCPPDFCQRLFLRLVQIRWVLTWGGGAGRPGFELDSPVASVSQFQNAIVESSVFWQMYHKYLGFAKYGERGKFAASVGHPKAKSFFLDSGRLRSPTRWPGFRPQNPIIGLSWVSTPHFWPGDAPLLPGTRINEWRLPLDALVGADVSWSVTGLCRTDGHCWWRQWCRGCRWSWTWSTRSAASTPCSTETQRSAAVVAVV